MNQFVPAARPALPVLTSLRFFAAALVVVHHFYFPTGHDWLSALGHSGPQCVIFFFVLSGFILTYAYSGATSAEGCSATPKRFWWARLARILPAYALGLALALPAFAYGALVSGITPMPAFITGLVLVPTFLQAWWSPAVYLWNAPAWSLSVEALFYAVFPYIASRASALRLPIAFGLALTILIASAVVTSALTPDAAAPPEAWAFRDRFPIFHLGEFLFGVALGRVFLFGRKLPRTVHRLMFAAGTVISVGLMASQFSLPGWIFNNAILSLTFGLLIYGAAGAGHTPVLSSRPLVVLGEASYGLYILHMPLLFFWTQMVERTGFSPQGELDFIIYFLGAAFISVAVLLYWENPLRRRMLHWSRRRETAAGPALI